MIVKIPATPAGIPTMEEATYRGTSIHPIVCKFADFRRAMGEEVLAVDEFDAFGPTRRTLRQFIAACHELETLVRDVVVPNPDIA